MPTASLVVVILYISPVLSVCQYGLSGPATACLLEFKACCSTSTTGYAINIPNPMSCRGSHHVLSVSVPSCRRGATDPVYSRPFLWIFVPTPTFVADPRVVGLAPAEHLHAWGAQFNIRRKP